MNLDDCDRLFSLQLFRTLQSGKSAVAFWFLRVLNRALASFIEFSYLHIFYEVHLLKVIRYDFSVISCFCVSSPFSSFFSIRQRELTPIELP